MHRDYQFYLQNSFHYAPRISVRALLPRLLPDILDAICPSHQQRVTHIIFSQNVIINICKENYNWNWFSMSSLWRLIFNIWSTSAFEVANSSGRTWASEPTFSGEASDAGARRKPLRIWNLVYQPLKPRILLVWTTHRTGNPGKTLSAGMPERFSRVMRQGIKRFFDLISDNCSEDRVNIKKIPVAPVVEIFRQFDLSTPGPMKKNFSWQAMRQLFFSSAGNHAWTQTAFVPRSCPVGKIMNMGCPFCNIWPCAAFTATTLPFIGEKFRRQPWVGTGNFQSCWDAE